MESLFRATATNEFTPLREKSRERQIGRMEYNCIGSHFHLENWNKGSRAVVRKPIAKMGPLFWWFHEVLLATSNLTLFSILGNPKEYVNRFQTEPTEKQYTKPKCRRCRNGKKAVFFPTEPLLTSVRLQ